MVTVICPQCQEHGRGRVEMTPRQELSHAWTFDCRQCGTRRVVTKDKVGGTVGSGQRDDGRASAMGKGYGPGRYRPVR